MLIALFSCNEMMLMDPPVLAMGEVSEVDTLGAVFHGKLLNKASGEVDSYGFVWGKIADVTQTNGEFSYADSISKKGVFHQRVSTAIGTGKKYYVRAFAKKGDFVAYSNPVEFSGLGSTAPLITEFYPSTCRIGETVVVKGRNFSNNPSSNVVMFDSCKAVVLSSYQDSLIVQVPQALIKNQSSLSVSVLGHKRVADSKFSIKFFPVIEEASSLNGTFGDHLILKGSHFTTYGKTVRVFLDTYEAKILSLQDDQVEIVVPDSLKKNANAIRLKKDKFEAVFSKPFQITPFTIRDFSPKVALTGSIITVSGSGFSPVADNNVVVIGGVRSSVLQVSKTELTVRMPNQDKVNYDSRNASLRVSFGEETKTAGAKLLINDSWFRRGTLPESFTPSNIVTGYGVNGVNRIFVVNGKAYAAMNTSTQFWKYDPETDEWTRLADYPGAARIGASGFAIGNSIYLGTGFISGFSDCQKDFWRYDISNNTWHRLGDFKGESRRYAYAFSDHDAGFLGGGSCMRSHIEAYPKDFWRYEPATDTWVKLLDINFNSVNATAVVTPNGSFIITNLPKPILYRMEQDQKWTNLGECYRDVNQTVNFYLGSTVYFKNLYSKYFYYFDVSTPGKSNWKSMLSKIPSDMSNVQTFTIGDKAYVTCGDDRSLWEFDPNR